MPSKTASSTLALAAAGVFALSSAAFAQTMVGDQEVSSEDLAAVTEHCQTLAAAETETTGTDSMAATTDDAMTGDDAATGDMASDSAATDDMASDGAATDDMATGATTDDTASDGDMAGGGVDLEAITLADCEGAGLATQ